MLILVKSVILIILSVENRGGNPMAIEESKFNINIKPEFLPLLAKSKADKTIDDKVNLSIAVFSFTERAVTLARAAELSGKSIGEFVNILISHNIPWAEYAEEHKRQDDEAIQYILDEHE